MIDHSDITIGNGAPPAGPQLLFDSDLEQLFVAAVIAVPSRHDLIDVTITDLADYNARAAYQAFANVRARDRDVTPDKVRAELERTGFAAAVSGLRADPDRGWFDELVAIEVPPDPPVASWAYRILDLAVARAQAMADADSAENDIDRDALADVEASPAPSVPRPRTPWRRAPDLVDEILERAKDPWMRLTLGGEEVVRVRAGGIAVVMGPSGSGKSSLVSNFLVEHARHVGPSIALSIELPADEMAGRIVGMQCDASWEDALRGAVRREFMVDALNLPRLYVIERQDATMTVLERCIDAAAKEYPGEQILVAIDYTQLIEGKEREVRMQVADALRRIDRLSREKRVVTIAVSQMSRAASKAARDGEKIGADSADGGAESAAIERFATLTLSIGAASEERSDGARAVELSLGKGRMSGGDKVFPAIYWGRTGRWRLDGVAQSASSVRDSRDTERAAKAQQALAYALLGAAAKSPEPISRENLAESVPGRISYKRSAIACLIAQGDLVEVQQHATRSRHWKVWTPDRAAAGNAKLVRDMENEDD